MSLNSEGFRLFDGKDVTKKAKFVLSGITPGTTRVLTVPDKDGTFSLEGHTHGSLPGKTVSYLFQARRKAGTQSIQSGVWSKVTFTTENFDFDSCFDLNNNRFVAPENGIYFFSAAVSMTPSSGARVLMSFYKNGAEDYRGADGPAVNTYWTDSMSTMIQLNAGDYVELYIYHSSTSARNVTFADFCGWKVG